MREVPITGREAGMLRQIREGATERRALLAERDSLRRTSAEAYEHNLRLVADLASLRGVVQAVREWAHTNHGGIKTPAEVWPGLAALLAEPALAAAADAPQPEGKS